MEPSEEKYETVFPSAVENKAHCEFAKLREKLLG